MTSNLLGPHRHHYLPVCVGLENGTDIPDYDTYRDALLHGPDEGIP